MEQKGVDVLVDRWLNEPAFRQAMKADLEGTVRSSGIELNDEEWATVRNVVTLSDAELRERVSKGWQN